MLDSQSNVFPLPLLHFILESNFSISMMFLIYIHIWVAISLHSASLSVYWGHIIIYLSSVASLLLVWEIPMFYRKCKWYRIYFPFNLIFPDAAYHGYCLLSEAPFSFKFLIYYGRDFHVCYKGPISFLIHIISCCHLLKVPFPHSLWSATLFMPNSKCKVIISLHSVP